VVLARVVTSGDLEFVDLVSPHAVYDEPRALAFCLETQLLAAQCIFCFSPPGNSFGPRFAMFAKPFPRFRLLCEGIEQEVQGLLASSDEARIKEGLNAALASENSKSVWEKRIRGAKILYYSEIAERLVNHIQKAWSEIAKRIRNEEMRAAAVPIDGGVPGPAGDMPPSAITDEMFIGEDSCIHQSKNSARKWKVSWIEEVANGKFKGPSDNGRDGVLRERGPGRQERFKRHAPHQELPQRPFLDVTEVYTFYALGNPLTAAELRKTIKSDISLNLEVWGDPHGPEWLEPHLKQLAAMSSWPPKKVKAWKDLMTKWSGIKVKRDSLYWGNDGSIRFTPDEALLLRQAADAFGYRPKKRLYSVESDAERDKMKLAVLELEKGVGIDEVARKTELKTETVQGLERDIASVLVEFLQLHKNSRDWLSNRSPDEAYGRVKREIEKRKLEIEKSCAFKRLLFSMAGEEEIPLFDGDMNRLPPTYFGLSIHFIPEENTFRLEGALPKGSPFSRAYTDVRLKRSDAENLLQRLQGIELGGQEWTSYKMELTPKANPIRRPNDLRENIKNEVLSKRGPGRPPDAQDAAEAQMKEDIKSGLFTPECLSRMKKVALAKQYGVHRDTACKALQNVLAENARN
jgi:hypothetical protein